MDFSHLRHRFRHASLGARVIAGLTILTISIAAVYSVTLWWSFTWVKNYVAADLMNSQLTAKIQALENGVAPQTNPGDALRHQAGRKAHPAGLGAVLTRTS